MRVHGCVCALAYACVPLRLLTCLGECLDQYLHAFARICLPCCVRALACACLGACISWCMHALERACLDACVHALVLVCLYTYVRILIFHWLILTQYTANHENMKLIGKFLQKIDLKITIRSKSGNTIIK